jgi:hypothetical protein
MMRQASLLGKEGRRRRRTSAGSWSSGPSWRPGKAPLPAIGLRFRNVVRRFRSRQTARYRNGDGRAHAPPSPAGIEPPTPRQQTQALRFGGSISYPVLHVIERIVARAAFGSMSHRLGWMRDCRTAVGCRPISWRAISAEPRARLLQPSHASCHRVRSRRCLSQGHFGAPILSPLFRRSAGPPPSFALGWDRRQPADNASVDGGSTDAMDPRSVPWSVVES